MSKWDTDDGDLKVVKGGLERQDRPGPTNADVKNYKNLIDTVTDSPTRERALEALHDRDMDLLDSLLSEDVYGGEPKG